jgi:hypothetical protein
MLSSAMVVAFRDAADVGMVIPDVSRMGLFDTISDGDQPGDFHCLDLVGGFSTSQIAAIAYTRFKKRMGLNRHPVAVLNVGWPGTSSEKFLPDGASFNFVNDGGVAQTINAVSHPAAGDYLWTRNIVVRQSIADFIATEWVNRTTRYSFLSYIQGPFEDGGATYGFMGEYRAQQDLLPIPGQNGARNILWEQNAGTSNDPDQALGSHAQMAYCQDNTSGRDWLIGPRYPHKLRDNIHHSAFGVVGFAERTGQAAAYIEMYGEWQPLWIENVAFSGAVCTLTTNRPRQCVGDLVIDTVNMDAQPQFGFTLWNNVADVETPCTVVVNGNTVTLTAASALSGQIEVGYTARGAVNLAGTELLPQWSATIGNIRMTGRDAPAIIPTTVQPTLDHWLCRYRKNFTV